MRRFFLLLLLFFNSHLSGQIITTVAGNGSYGYSGDGGPAIFSQMANPTGVVADNNGNIYIADFDNNVIRKVNSTGTITTFGGNGTLGYSGDGGMAVSAKLYHPNCITLDNVGNVYFADQNGNVIRKINTSGIISSITANLSPGYSGDGGLLMSAQVNGISNIAFDNVGNMYISDFGNNVIRKVNSSGIINTIVGTGVAGFSGDGGLATSAKLDAPYGVIATSNGDIFISDARNNRIRKVNSSGIINTYAGTGASGYTGDGGAAILATFRFPTYSTIDNIGNIYITDPLNLVVRKIDNAGIITTFAGNGTQGYSGDGGLATLAQMADVSGVDFDEIGGNLYIVNRNLANVIRKVSTCLSATITQQPVNSIICNSGNTTFSINATNTTAYQWQLNTGAGWINLTNNSIYSGSQTNSLLINGVSISMNNFQYRCVLSNACGSIFSAVGLLLVNTPANPSIMVSTPSTNICSGSSAFFSASVQFGGSSPVYQWKKNNINVGTNSNTYNDNSLVNGDIIRCTLISSGSCVTGNTANSNFISMTVSTLSAPSVAISGSANNICFGTPVTFTSSITNGGSNPVFNWFKNGVNLFLNSPMYTDNLLNNGDIIVCSITSSLSCVTSSMAVSSPIIMTVIQLVLPSVTISSSANSVCRNAFVTFTASSLNGGSLPIYQWKKNGIQVGSNSNIYSANTFNNGDMITCTLTSNINCGSIQQVTSNTLRISILPDPVVNLDKNNSLCDGKNRILDAGTFASYLWNTGSTNRTIAINNIGLYSVTVTDINGCSGTDFTNITRLLPTPKGYLPKDTSICSYSNLLLRPISSFETYLWNTGSNSYSINITQPGQYWLKVTNNDGCTGIDTIKVFPKECLRGFFMPTAFTPNNDGKNDYIKPILLGNIKQYNFRIYNRFGQLIFQTTDISKSWNGNYKGLNQDGNVFVWMCTYQFENELTQNEKGTFILIK